jgi:hypothetical protein
MRCEGARKGEGARVVQDQGIRGKGVRQEAGIPKGYKGEMEGVRRVQKVRWHEDEEEEIETGIPNEKKA